MAIKQQMMPPIPEGVHPMVFDQYHMAQAMGTNILLMFPNHSSEECKYIIVVELATGKRTKLEFNKE